MSSSAPKRQKRDNAKEPGIAFRSEECVSFDALTETDYPIELVVENLLRMLNYDTLQGIGELVSLSVRCAGCSAEFELSSEESSDPESIANSVSQVETSCINAEHGCPATYPLQKNEFSKRVARALGAVTMALNDSGGYETLSFISSLLAALSTVRLQSLRFVATMFAGVMTTAFPNERQEQANEAYNTLVEAVVKRCSDIAVPIRRRAISDLGRAAPEEVSRGLYDVNASVRLAALRTLSSYANDTESVNERIVQMAGEDVDLAVRKSALRYLVGNGVRIAQIASNEPIMSMLRDEDEPSRKLAGELIVMNYAMESPSSKMLLVNLARLDPANRAAALALVHGLDKVRGQYRVHWPVELALILVTDYNKESRKAKLSTAVKNEYKTISQNLDNEDTQFAMLKLLAASLLSGSLGSASALDYITPLIHKMQHSEKLLSETITAFSYLKFESLMARTELEKQSNHFFEVCREIFIERSNSREVIEAVAKVFGAMPQSRRFHLLEDIHQDLRIKLADLLGPRGEFSSRKKPQIKAAVLQLIVIGRYVDISDLARLPLWPGLMGGDEDILQLVRALGMKGDTELVKTVIQKLSQRKSGPAVDDILRVLVSAKLRGINVDMNFPVDINETGPDSETLWRAAVAAGVI